VVAEGGVDTRRLLQYAGFSLHAQAGCHGVWTQAA
jgi:hypothetical protein